MTNHSGVARSAPWWVALMIFVFSLIVLCLAAWLPPSKPEFIIEPCKAALFGSLGFLIGYPVTKKSTDAV